MLLLPSTLHDKRLPRHRAMLLTAKSSCRWILMGIMRWTRQFGTLAASLALSLSWASNQCR